VFLLFEGLFTLSIKKNLGTSDDLRTYRLSFHPTIIKDGWYFGVYCHKCSNAIHSLENMVRSPLPPQFIGKALFSIPCYHCGHDDLYEISELVSQISSENRQSFKDKRPAPNRNNKQPYLPTFKKYKVNIGIEAIELLPEISMVVARIISNWTLVETQLSRFLSICLGANTEPSVALYLSLKNSRAKKDALEAVVSLTLQQQDQELFYATMRWKEAVEKSRNDIAHGVFGASLQTRDHLFWISTGDYAIHSVAVQSQIQKGTNAQGLYKRLFVFEIGSLERIAREIESLFHFLGFFGGYLTSSDPDWRRDRYPHLCSEPRVAEELRNLRERQKT